MATIWSPEPTGADEILSTSIEEWIADVEFESIWPMSQFLSDSSIRSSVKKQVQWSSRKPLSSADTC